MDLTRDDLLEVIIRELGWNLAAFALTGIVCVIVMRVVLGLRIVDIVREVEEEHNGAVGAAFFTVALLSGLWFGKIGGDFTSESTTGEQIAWSIIGFVIATAIFVAAFYLVFRVLCHRRGERVIPYIRREAIAENNTAIILFVGSLAVVPYTLAAMITV